MRPLICALLLSGCVAASSNIDYRTPIARSLEHYPGDPRTFLITGAWWAATGELVACVRPQLPNGAGGAVGGDDSMFAVADGAVTHRWLDKNCIYRTDYTVLETVPR